MKRFHFRLDPALRLRRTQEEQAQMELAERLRLLGRAQAQRDELCREERRHSIFRASLLASELDIWALQEAERYAQALARTLWEQEQRVSHAALAADTSRSILSQRRTERESLERLRAQREEQHRQEQLSAEQQELDEASILRWRR